MKTNMSYATIIELINILDKFSDASGVLGMNIARTKQGLREEYNIFMQERAKIIMKYGKADEQGNYSVPQDNSDNFKNFVMELAQIMDMTIEVNLYQVTKEQFDIIYDNENIINNTEITVRDYEILGELFVKGRLKDNSEDEKAQTEAETPAESKEVIAEEVEE